MSGPALTDRVLIGHPVGLSMAVVGELESELASPREESSDGSSTATANNSPRRSDINRVESQVPGIVWGVIRWAGLPAATSRPGTQSTIRVQHRLRRRKGPPAVKLPEGLRMPERSHVEWQGRSAGEAGLAQPRL